MRKPRSVNEVLGLIVFVALFVWVLVYIAGCSGPAVKPEEIVQTRTVTTEVRIPVPVPCVNRADVPPLPASTDINVDTAKTDQKAAATAADAEQYERYAKAAAALIEQCVKTGGK